jgi:hypothetical protein
MYNLLNNVPSMYKDMFLSYMNANGVTVKYNFHPNGMMKYVHLTHNKSKCYIVAKVSADDVKLLCVGKPFVQAPENIPAKNAGNDFRYMMIGLVQGLFWDDGQWNVCNHVAYNCNNLLWHSTRTVSEHLDEMLGDYNLDKTKCYTVVHYLGDVFTKKKYIYFIESYDVAEPDFKPKPIPTYLPTLEAPETDDLNTLMLKSHIDELLSGGQDYRYGLLEITPGAIKIHMTDLGKAITSLFNNKILSMPSDKRIAPRQHKTCILLLAICSIGKEQEIMRKLSPHNNEELDKLNRMIDEIVERVANNGNILSYANDEFITLFAEKFQEQLNICMNADKITIRDFLIDHDFIPLYLREIEGNGDL